MTVLNSGAVELRERLINDAVAAALPSPLSSLERRLVGARIDDASTYQTSFASLIHARYLPQLDAAHQLLYRALQHNARIVIVGDYDADGATALTLVYGALRAFGAQQVDFFVPNRFVHGYGLSEAIIEELAPDAPDLIITVDNGVASLAGVAAAQMCGIDVLITDHHLPGPQLPEAVVVNPNIVADNPLASLAGVGVAFYLMASLRTFLSGNGWLTDGGGSACDLRRWLDLVAVGTIADGVPIDANNRILVDGGLRMMRAGRASVGIRALAMQAGIDLMTVGTEDIAFRLAPRLNAAGRLTDMRVGIACLLADDSDEAAALAQTLSSLNDERRSIEHDMLEQAKAMLAAYGERTQPALSIYNPDWHQGVCGILASRLKEGINRPVAVFANAKQDDDGGEDRLLKGSLRSVDGVHVRDVLERIYVCHDDVIVSFGGHAMAAGVTIRFDRLDAFSRLFSRYVHELFGSDDTQGHVIWHDGTLPSTLTLDEVSRLRTLLPWGNRLSPPRFCDTAVLLQQRLVGDGRHLRLRVRLLQQEMVCTAMLFRHGSLLPCDDGTAIRLCYRPDVSVYQDEQRLQLLVEYVIL